MERILIHIKNNNNSFVICGPLHPEYAANLVASSEVIVTGSYYTACRRRPEN